MSRGYPVVTEPDRATGCGCGLRAAGKAMNTISDQHGCIAAGEGITRLTVEHLQVIRMLREHYLTGRRIPVMRQLCREVGVTRHRVSALLQDPVAAWCIAGRPYPGKEALAHLECTGVTERKIP